MTRLKAVGIKDNMVKSRESKKHKKVYYKSGEFCHFISCDIRNGSKQQCSACMAYQFHDYLVRAGYEITMPPKPHQIEYYEGNR